MWNYIAAHNPQAADNLADRLDRTLAMLAEAPGIGKYLKKFGLRCFPVGKYVIFYRPIPEGIQLIRVLHGAREILPKLFEG